MADCKRIQRKHRKVCIGDLNELITIKNRGIQAATPGQQKFTEKFDNDKEVWAMVETTRGDQFFDGTSLRTAATHIFTIRFDANVTQEDYIFFADDIYDILDCEDLDERGEFLKMPSRKRGTKDIKVNEG